MLIKMYKLNVHVCVYGIFKSSVCRRNDSFNFRSFASGHKNMNLSASLFLFRYKVRMNF